MSERKCAGCGQLHNKEEMIKITRQTPHGDLIINPDSKVFGRSVYLCYNNNCIENAFKKNKISKALKTSVPQELKGKLINEF